MPTDLGRRLTPRQIEVARFIRDFRARTGCSPTLQEVAYHFGVSKIAAYEATCNLVRKGVLEKTPNGARSLSVADDFKFPAADGCCPMCGKRLDDAQDV